MRGKLRSNILYRTTEQRTRIPFPLWERVASRSDSEDEPGEGVVPQLDSAPSPALARLRLGSGTLSHKVRGKSGRVAAVVVKFG